VNSRRIREYVVDNFLFGEANGLGDDDSFIEQGIIDSTGILELIYFLEENYSIKVDDADLLPENLDSINRVVGFLQRKAKNSNAG